MIPAESDWAPIDGWGDFRMQRGDTDVSFSGEMVGWQVTFEGPISEEDAREVIEVVTFQIQKETGEPVEFVQIGGSD